jgi:hypothetical protein
MKDRLALARGWFRKADSDLTDARRTAASEGPYDTACFHAQQAVEKYRLPMAYRARLLWLMAQHMCDIRVVSFKEKTWQPKS